MLKEGPLIHIIVERAYSLPFFYSVMVKKRVVVGFVAPTPVEELIALVDHHRAPPNQSTSAPLSAPVMLEQFHQLQF